MGEACCACVATCFSIKSPWDSVIAELRTKKYGYNIGMPECSPWVLRSPPSTWSRGTTRLVSRARAAGQLRASLDRPPIFRDSATLRQGGQRLEERSDSRHPKSRHQIVTG